METTPRPSINIITALLLLCLRCFTGPAMAERPSIFTDQASLLALKQHVTHDPQDLLSTNWTETTSVCNWVGITCGTTHISRVTSLNLAFMGLSGTLPPQLGNLSFLAYFSITNNTFHGSLPGDLSRLRRLQYFSVRDNSIEGEMPPWLASLPRLKYLFLNGNGFSGTIPESICNMSTLQKLDLSENQLTGMIPPLIFNIPMLKMIDLSNNRLSGVMPSSIFNESPLWEVYLDYNSLSGDLPRNICGNLPNLQVLSLSANQFSGEIPFSLSECRQLQWLSLLWNNFSGTIPRELGNLTMLNGLYLGHNNLNAILALGLLFVLARYLRRNRMLSTEEASMTFTSRRRISYYEVLRATNGLSPSNLLGAGSFGSVYKGTLSDGLNIAVKVFNLELEGALKSFGVECEVLRNIRHRNLVKILSSCCNLDFIALILEYRPNGSLERWLHYEGYYLDILGRLDIMIDVASGLEYLHEGYSTPIVHCDLKPSNVLLGEDLVACLCDFGIAKLLGEEKSMTRTKTLATIGYMAPEYGSGGFVSTRGDVYSYGILLMETFTAKRPTDEMFFEEESLKRWVEDSLPHAVGDILDVNLLSREELTAAKLECVLPILELATHCCVELPEERMRMNDVLAKLKKIRAALRQM